MNSMQVEDINWLVQPVKDAADLGPAYASPWPDPYSDMLDMNALDPSFTASLQDPTIVDPNLIGGFEDPPREAEADAEADANPAPPPAIKDEISPDTSPDVDVFSQPSSGKRSSSLVTSDSLPPSLPTPPPAQPRKRGRPQKRQPPVPEQEKPPAKRKRCPPQKASPPEDSPTTTTTTHASSSADASLASNEVPAAAAAAAAAAANSDERLSQSPSAPAQSRRSRIREKNRIAACKCRRKQRKAVSKLTSRHEGLEDLNRQLCGQVSELEAEAYALKNMLMAHGNCGCEMIQQYFKDAAASLVQKVDVEVGGPSAASTAAGPRGSRGQ